MTRSIDAPAPERSHAAPEAVLRRLAARYVWWKPAGEVLSDPAPLLWSILSIGTAEDYVTVRNIVGEAALIAALQRAPSGAVDQRSWSFWHDHFKLAPMPSPKRAFS